MSTAITANDSNPTASTPLSTLAEIAPGWVRCSGLTAEGDNSIRLRRLGICQGRLIELVGRGDPMILHVGGTRIGLSRQLASMVQVELVDAVPSQSMR